jgi:hypothetical protein
MDEAIHELELGGQHHLALTWADRLASELDRGCTLPNDAESSQGWRRDRMPRSMRRRRRFLRIANRFCAIASYSGVILARPLCMEVAELGSWRSASRRLAVCRVFMALMICPCVLVAACASQHRQSAQTADAVPATTAKPPPARRDPEAGAAGATSPTGASLDRLTSSVRALADGEDDPGHHRVVRALRDAADALDSLGLASAGTVDPLRAAAGRIETSGTDSLAHAEQLRASLSAAEDRLRTPEPRAERSPAFELALRELEQSTEMIDASVPLLEQRPAVSRAFRALTDAMFLAAQRDAPFGGRAPESRSIAEKLEQARADVLAVGSAGLSDIRQLVSRAMHSLADLVAALGSRGETARRSAEVRAEARRLARDSGEPFARAGWVAAGLRAALAAVDDVQSEPSSVVESWTGMAQRSADRLPERGALPFEHAAIQDAMRATVDAIGVALLRREVCPSAANHPATVRAPDQTAEPQPRASRPASANASGPSHGR